MKLGTEQMNALESLVAQGQWSLGSAKLVREAGKTRTRLDSLVKRGMVYVAHETGHIVYRPTSLGRDAVKSRA